MPVLGIRNLTKRYGSTNVVNGLNLSVEKGSIFGFLGLNGAGKTTTIRMIMGLTRPNGGEITVCGERVRFGSAAANKHIGYLPDVPEFYGFMTPREYLLLCGNLSGMDMKKNKKRIDELLELVGLASVKRKIGGFSRGMKQRLGIAQSLIHEPELLILDEPTSALDPVGRKDILDIIASLKGRVTVVFSTHILADVQRVCDTIGILHHGHLELEGDLPDIEKKFAGQSFRLKVPTADKMNELKDRLSLFPFVREVRQEGTSQLLLISTDSGKLCEVICPLLAELNIPLSHFEQMESSLEDVFIEVIHGA
ncbi:ABC transporter ATP-binding protein [Sporolactobacillus putidus]|uniref:ABC transporter ATP-binding protein n=1 Tax=Sporolactobacillus putidus TaxID=492735 RepID=A0A917W3X2_9BACL|nr:ABC transporter ATP-binding protein [Sporolactobacillus putidus]GGL60881.1 ABC transporter ATP-binding protein [Sporolactobacillus putidus]